MMRQRLGRAALGRDDALSDVVGTIMMIAATVAIVGLVSVNILGSVDEAQPPAPVSFVANARAGDTTLTLTHEGGPTLAASDLRVVVSAAGTTLRDAPLAASGTWGLGQDVSVPLSAPLAAGQRVDVSLVSISHKATISSAAVSLPGGLAAGALTGSFAVAVMFATAASNTSIIAPSPLLVRASVSHPQGRLAITSVVADLSALGASSLPLADDGTSGDASAGDSIFSGVALVPTTAPVGNDSIVVRATDVNGLTATGVGVVNVTALNLTALAGANGTAGAPGIGSGTGNATYVYGNASGPFYGNTSVYGGAIYQSFNNTTVVSGGTLSNFTSSNTTVVNGNATGTFGGNTTIYGNVTQLLNYTNVTYVNGTGGGGGGGGGGNGTGNSTNGTFTGDVILAYPEEQIYNHSAIDDFAHRILKFGNALTWDVKLRLPAEPLVRPDGTAYNVSGVAITYYWVKPGNSPQFPTLVQSCYNATTHVREYSVGNNTPNGYDANQDPLYYYFTVNWAKVSGPGPSTYSERVLSGAIDQFLTLRWTSDSKVATDHATGWTKTFADCSNQ